MGKSLNICLLFSLLCLSVARGKTESRLPSIDSLRHRKVSVYFRQGSSVLDLSFRGNGAALNHFSLSLDSMRRIASFRIKGVKITASASPEGGLTINKVLAKKRARQVADYMRSHFALAHTPFDIICHGPNWQDLIERVQRSSVPYREEVLRILQEQLIVSNKSKPLDNRQKKLMRLNGGRVWHYMLKEFYPHLRQASVRLEYILEEEKKTLKEESEQIVQMTQESDSVETLLLPDTTLLREVELSLPITENTIQKKNYLREERHFFLAVKNNFIKDALLLPNLTLEAYFGRGWSLSASWHYAWWSRKEKHLYWQSYGGDMELRKYLSRQKEDRPLLGWHLGAYGEAFTYDVMLQPSKGLQGASWQYSTGISLGYSLPLKRGFFIDFNLGVGYLTGVYKEYEAQEDCYPWIATKRLRYFGPTKAEISIGYLIDFKHHKKVRRR